MGFQKSYYEELPVEDVMLDSSNPRIAIYLEIYRDEITSKEIALALNDGMPYGVLKDSIKANEGITNPIVVNKTQDGKYVVIEGNTRLQIYKDFLEDGMPGEWETIKAIVYENLDEDQIHAIRLQAHLVGPRSWDPYSKAKYLNHLSTTEALPLPQIVSFCGGKASEIKTLIDAFNAMEKYYRPLVEAADLDFDQQKFSAFVELQKPKIRDSILRKKYSFEDFSKWVMNGNIDTMMNVRKLPAILENKKATEVFLKENISEAEKVLYQDIETKQGDLKPYPYDVLANELLEKIRQIQYKEVRYLIENPAYEIKKSLLLDLKDELDELVTSITEE